MPNKVVQVKPTFFRFKRFCIGQDGASMKVGTDGVLLGAWCRIGVGHRRVLDIGTGTGLIALMIAQRLDAESADPYAIDALEIDRMAARQAADNAAASPWADRIRVLHTSLQSFAADPQNHARYDHIVSNPPYFGGALRSPDAARDKARHSGSLPHETLIAGVICLLSPGGVFSVILPSGEAKSFVTQAVADGLHPQRRTEVVMTDGSPPKRVLLEFGTRIATPVHDTLIVRNGANDGFSEAYRMLTRDFYLDF